MKYPLILITLMLSFATGFAAGGKHLFILSGQSNMADLNPDVSFTPAVERAFGQDHVTVVLAKSAAPIRTWYKDYQFPDKRETKDSNKEEPAANYANLIKAVKAATAGQKYDTAVSSRFSSLLTAHSALFTFFALFPRNSQQLVEGRKIGDRFRLLAAYLQRFFHPIAPHAPVIPFDPRFPSRSRSCHEANSLENTPPGLGAVSDGGRGSRRRP